MGTNRIFKRKGICSSLEELRDISQKSGIIVIEEITLDIWPTKDIMAKVKPYKSREGLAPINDWKGKLGAVELSLPFIDKVNKKLDKIYGTDGSKEIVFRWWETPQNCESWDYYDLTLFGRSLCESSGKQINKAIDTPDSYNSKLCHSCSQDIKNYCKSLSSIINKYALPREIEIKDYKKK